MREIETKELEYVNGSFKLNIGTAIGAMIGGFIAGGPFGLGMAIGVTLIAQGTNNLVELAETM